MISRKLIPLILLVLLVFLFVGVRSAAADSSHARVIRLSLVQGDVRFARETHGDPLADSRAVWEKAEANLPIEHGYVLATDNGRAEVEFENGAMAFLKEDTVLQFFDLSLKDGMFTTRLVVLQGSASFYVNPARGDYFSVTGGDFTVEANGRATFRLDNYDNGSSVEDMSGRLMVLHGELTSRLGKGQSLSMKAGDEMSVAVGRLPEQDEFDRWVSGQIDAVSAANVSASQYSTAPYYVPGFASLYSYGSFFNCGGYGYGWRPFGAGLGWSPFMDGQWVFDPTFGWTWVSYQPWGWAPYHYGGWLFDASCGGWFYSPPVFYGNYPGGGPVKRPPKRVNPPRPIFHAVTGVFVRTNGKLGIVPMHPLDEKGKAPLNLGHGVFNPVAGKGGGEPLLTAGAGQKWDTLKSAPKEAFREGLEPAAAPARVSRTVVQGGAVGARAITLNANSSIAYDAKEHRFVNSNSAPVSSREDKGTIGARQGSPGNPVVPAATIGVTSARNTAPPRVTVPPPAPRYGGGDRGSAAGSGGGRSWSGGGGGASASGGTHSSSSGSASSGGSASHSSSGGGSSGGGGGSHGGKP